MKINVCSLLHMLNLTAYYVTGRRTCLGEQLARQELFLFFANILKSFSIQTPEGTPALSEDPVLRLVLAPQSYKVCFVPRYWNYSWSWTQMYAMCRNTYCIYHIRFRNIPMESGNCVNRTSTSIWTGTERLFAYWFSSRLKYYKLCLHMNMQWKWILQVCNTHLLSWLYNICSINVSTSLQQLHS